MKNIISLVGALLLLVSCVSRNSYDALQTQLADFVEKQDARIGVAVIAEGQKVVGINEEAPFPMLSVYKFPIALALNEYCRENGYSLTDSCLVLQSDLHKDTYSPMLTKYGEVDSVRIPLCELLKYSLQQSDNNASDILLAHISGACYVQAYLDKLGFKDIKVLSSEAEMHDNIDLCYENTSTPLAMAKLLYMFDTEFDDNLSADIKQMMETCTTGMDRLVQPFDTAGVTVGHKTGTGFVLPDGTLMAINDAGYVHLKGKRYSIAVFVADSKYDMDRTAAIIAELSRMVADAMVGK